MTIPRTRRLLACSFFSVWLAILSAGAGHPPPVGFLWLILLDLIAAWLVYLRVAVYIGWSTARIRFRWFGVFLDGLVVGLLFAAIAILLPHDKEPGIEPSLVDHAIWFAVLTGVGVANSMLLYLFARLLSHVPKTKEKADPKSGG